MGNRNTYVSDFLFVKPSLLRGMARTLDLWGSLNTHNWSETPQMADAKAMAVDWGMVGSDLSQAMEQFSVMSETAKTQPKNG